MADDALPPALSGEIEQVQEATERLFAELSGLAGTDPGRPSLCPGWTAGHILTHIARNADGLRRTAEGAQRGESVPMYDSVEARNRDIEAGAGRSMPELIADVTASAAALSQAWTTLRAEDWTRQWPHRGGPRPVSDTPGMRLGEVEIHHIDLAGRFGPADWPESFVTALLPSVGELAHRVPDGLALDVQATDSGTSWAGGPDGARRVRVSGPSWAIAAWMVGRPQAARDALTVTDGDLPELNSWP